MTDFLEDRRKTGSGAPNILKNNKRKLPSIYYTIDLQDNYLKFSEFEQFTQSQHY